MKISEQDFLDIIENNDNRLQHICRIYAENDEEEKDIYQEIITEAWHSLTSFKEKASISTWLYRIGINTAISYNRKKETRKDYHEKYGKEQPAPSYNATENEENEKLTQLYRAISSLNASKKAIIAMYLDDFSYREISYATNITENYVGVKLNRIKKHLSKKIEEYNGHE